MVVQDYGKESLEFLKAIIAKDTKLDYQDDAGKNLLGYAQGQCKAYIIENKLCDLNKQNKEDGNT